MNEIVNIEAEVKRSGRMYKGSRKPELRTVQSDQAQNRYLKSVNVRRNMPIQKKKYPTI